MLFLNPELLEEKVAGWRESQTGPLKGLVQVETTKAVDQEIINMIVAGLKERNLIAGATVVSKKVPPIGRKIPSNWGIVTHVNLYAPKGVAYKPLVVQWINGTRQEMHENDILLIQPPPLEESLNGLLECTGC